MQLNKEKMALLFAFTATLFTGLYGTIVKVLENNHFGPTEIAAIRAILCFAIVGVVLLIFKRESFVIDKKDIWIFVVFGIAQLAYSLFAIYAITDDVGGISPALGAALQSISPYFTIAIAFFMFKEKITANKFVAILVGFIGCLFASGVFSGDIQTQIFGVVLAVLSALFVAIFNIGSKYTGSRGYSTETALFYFYLINAIALLPIALVNNTAANICNSGADVWMAVIAIGLVSTAIPQYLTIKAFQMGDTGKVSVILMFDIVTSGIFCWVFLGIGLGIMEIIGILLIIASLIIIELNIGAKRDLVPAK